MKVRCVNKNNLCWVYWLVFALHILAGFGCMIGGLVYGTIGGIVGILVGIAVFVDGAILGELIKTFGDIERNTRSSYEMLEYLANHQIKMDEQMIKCGQYICDRMADMCHITV